MPESTTPTLLSTPTGNGNGQIPARANGGQPPKPKVKKLRLFLILLGLFALALISTVFGMMMAVAGDLPELENRVQFEKAKNSILIADAPGKKDVRIAQLTGNDNRVLLEANQISPHIKNAVIAMEDRRFYDHKGVDYRGIARALWADIAHRGAVQGASTITQQFVKNATAAQGDRTVFQKLREAALAYHLERQWSKSKILTQYLNTIYFGNGAYGIESAVRTYFRRGGRYDPDPHAPKAAQNVTPYEAALLAGMIASPSAYDPVQNPRAARDRRNLVLQRMLEQHMISQQEYNDGIVQALPSEGDVKPPRPDSRQPYFSTWVTQQLVDRYGSGRVFGGDLKIRTTIDPAMQQAAEQAIVGRIGGIGMPKASMVVIENKTGEVKAMVGGNNFTRKPFNLAVNGHRQPGSAFKPFTLLTALQRGIGPGSLWTSKQKIFKVKGSPGERFVVNNYEKRYAGVTTLASATANSDNSVYAELGIKLKPWRIARLAKKMGIRTKVSTNPAMTLGGLKEGVNPLEMAYAYATIANNGRRVSGNLAAWDYGPVAIQSVRERGGDEIDHNDRRTRQVFPEGVANTAKGLLAGVIQHGTGTRAKLPEFAAGKTGTTENYGDAWFVGFNKDWTAAVWVGYPDRLRPMKTEYHGEPVAGGTFPAEIWHDFMMAAIKIRDARNPDEKDEQTTTGPSTPTAPPAGAQGEPQTPAENKPVPVPDEGGGAPPERDGGGGGERTPPEQPPEQPPAEPAPAPAPTPPPDGGGGGTAPNGAGQ
jgi:penicillin-binding protein 1A